MHHHMDSESGHTLLIVLISSSILGGILLVMMVHGFQITQLYKDSRYSEELMDLRNYILENFSCEETRKQVKCTSDSEKFDTYRKNSTILSDLSGSVFARFKVRASCNNDEYNFFYTDNIKTNDNETSTNWKHLFESIPINCRDLGCKPSDTLTFENFSDGGTMVHNTKVSNQFSDSHGVSFSDMNGDPLLAGIVNAPNFMDQAWRCNPSCGHPNPVKKGVRNGIAPNSDPDQPIGTFFLRNEYNSGKKSGVIINYNVGVRELSGTIIDFDSNETITFTAFNKDGSILYNKSFYDPKQDGKAWRWEIGKSGLAPGEIITRVTIEGTKTSSGFGLAFDNFSPSKVCHKIEL